MDFDESPNSTGFLFEKATSKDFAGGIRRALSIFTNRDEWQALQKRGMSIDFSWESSARQYQDLYRSITRKKRKKLIKTPDPEKI
jgi:starch synthase